MLGCLRISQQQQSTPDTPSTMCSYFFYPIRIESDKGIKYKAAKITAIAPAALMILSAFETAQFPVKSCIRLV